MRGDGMPLSPLQLFRQCFFNTHCSHCTHWLTTRTALNVLYLLLHPPATREEPAASETRPTRATRGTTGGAIFLKSMGCEERKDCTTEEDVAARTVK
jgi:hypothetical protein